MTADQPAPAGGPRRRIELATAGVFAALLLVVIAAYAPLREAIVESARSQWDNAFPSQWAAYYLEVDQSDPMAQSDPEMSESFLMFASGALPGKASRLLEDRVHSGTWSPNGERFIVSSGTRLFICDRHGQVRQLTDLGDLLPTAPAIWNGDKELLVATTRDGSQKWLMRLDPRTGSVLDQRDMPLELEPYAPSPDGRWLLAVDQRSGNGILYEIATGKRILPGRREGFAAWLGDGRVLLSVIDDEGAHLSARKPEGGDAQVLADLDGLPLLPAVSSGGRVAIVEAQSGDPSAPRAIWLIAPGETPVRVAKDLGKVYFPKPSRDGRYVSFSERSQPAEGPVRIRTGIIDVTTKAVSYACAAGCAVLDVR